MSLTQQFQDQTKDFFNGMAWIQKEAFDIEKAYSSSDAQSTVTGLGSGTDAATLATKLTKDQYTNAIGFLLQLQNFFDNSAVTTGDYLGVIDQVIYGNAATPTFLTDATESIGNRLRELCDSALEHYNKALELKDFYDASEFSVLVAGLSGGRRIYGATMNNTQLTQGITVIEQYKNMISNTSVTAGLYSQNVSVWVTL